MNIRTKLMTAAAALSLTAMTAIAADGAKAGHRGGHRLFGRGAAALNLTDQQKDFSKQLMADTRKQAQPVVEQLRQNRQELAAAVKTNNTAAIDQLTQQQATLRGQLSALHAKAMASFYAQLTPEQKAKADEMHSRVKQRQSHRQNRG